MGHEEVIFSVLRGPTRMVASGGNSVEIWQSCAAVVECRRLWRDLDGYLRYLESSTAFQSAGRKNRGRPKPAPATLWFPLNGTTAAGRIRYRFRTESPVCQGGRLHDL